MLHVSRLARQAAGLRWQRRTQCGRVAHVWSCGGVGVAAWRREGVRVTLKSTSAYTIGNGSPQYRWREKSQSRNL
jgi:hypothetical protein